MGGSHTKFSPSAIKDMTGKVVVITGATAGLGKESALRFAEKNATVYVLGRNLEKGETVVMKIREETRNKNVYFMLADHMDLFSIKAFAEDFMKKNVQIDILLLNAGIAFVSYAETMQGIETTFGVNFLSHYYLVKLLLPLILRSKSRVVHVSSSVITMSSVIPYTIDGYNTGPDKHSPAYSYGYSKAANLLFAQWMARKYGADGVVSIAIEPGTVNTSIADPKPSNAGLTNWLLRNIIFPIGGVPVTEGALPQIYASVSSEVHNGGTYGSGCKPWVIPAVLSIENIVPQDKLIDFGEELLRRAGM